VVHRNFLHFHPDDVARAGDEHDVLLALHLQDAGNIPDLRHGLQVDRSLAAPRLNAVFVNRRAFAVAVLRNRQHKGVLRGNLHADDVIALIEVDAADAAGRAAHVAHVVFPEADRHAQPRGQENILIAVGQLHIHQFVIVIDGNGDNAAGARIGISRQIGFFDDAFARDHHDELVRNKFLDRQRRADALSRRQADQIDHGLALGRPPGLRDLIHFQPVHFSGAGEDQEVMMGGSNEYFFDKILLLGAHADLAPPAAVLALVQTDGVALDVAGMRDGDHHVFFHDHVFNVDVFRAGDDFRAALIAVFFPDLLEFIDNHFQHLLRIVQNARQFGDQRRNVRVFRVDLVPLQAGQPLQTHVQNGFGLNLGQSKRRAQRHGRIVGAFGRLDDLDDFIDVVQRDDIAF